MNDDFLEITRQACNADSIYKIEDIQSLWSGYGKIMRYGLNGSAFHSVIVKHVNFPDQHNHPRGWNTDLSHQRKVHSYQVETLWYQNWSSLCDNDCRVPKCLGLESHQDEVLIVLEDLDDSGFPKRKNSVTMAEMQTCLHWLANFHATFMQYEPSGLWPIGTYWHLDTRPEEFAALNDLPLKNAAQQIDQILRQSPYQTFVHGDAKLANFCFSKDGHQVAAVDFQYVGGGCGMKDVAYFIGSCLYEEDCEKYESELLDYYFKQLTLALAEKRPSIDVNAVEENWRSLYPIAWTDFHRFVKGWSPGHWKIHGYSERLARQVIDNLETAA